MTGCSKVPGTIDPSIFLPVGISSDAAKALLENPNINPNASGPMVPFSDVCGDYMFFKSEAYTLQQPMIYNGVSAIHHKSYSFWVLFRIKNYVAISNEIRSNYEYYDFYMDTNGNFISPGPYPTSNPLPVYWSLPCDLLPLDASVPATLAFPSGTVKPSGYPDGDYVLGGQWFKKSGGSVTYKGTVNPACDPDGARPPAKLTSLLITPVDVSIGVNKTTQLNVRGMRSDGSIDAAINNSNVTWTSSDASIAVVYNGGTSGGYVLGKSKGNATISATYGSTPSNVVVVRVGNQLQSISVSPASTTIYIHPTAGTQQYTATGSYTDGTVTTPLTVDWKSSDTAIATIDNNGLATAVGIPGITYISAASTADGATIFSNLPDRELCVECRNYPHIRQNAGWWVDDPYARNWTKDVNGNYIDNGPRTTNDLGQTWSGQFATYQYSISNKGCHLTCAAMLLSATTGTSVDPRLLNNWLNNWNGYDTGNGPKWAKLKQYPNSKIISYSDELSVVTSDIDTLLQNCDAVIALVKNSALSLKHHYVLIIKGKQGQYKIYDPWVLKNTKGIPTESIIQEDTLDLTQSGTHQYQFLAYRRIFLSK